MINEKGFIFLEILISVALISVVFVTFLGINSMVLNISQSITLSTRALALARGEIEAVRSFRDANTWSDFTNVNFGGSNNYYFSISGSSWVRNAGTETVDVFSRKVVFDQVYRDGSGNIASSGTLDSETIKMTVTVSWPPSKSIQIVDYLTNWQAK